MQAVILAAGRGSRLQPLSATRPKPLQPVGSKPLIAHVVDDALAGGADELLVVTGFKGERIREYLEQAYGDAPIAYATQQSPAGTADALRAVADRIEGPFCVLNGDSLYDRDGLAELMANGPSIGAVRVDDPGQYGVLTTDNGRITGIIEKPDDPPTDIVNAGAYVFPEHSLELLDVPKSDRGEYELTDVVNRVIETCDVSPVQFGRWLDVGRPWELLEANRTVLAQQERRIDGTVHPSATIDGAVVVEDGSTVRAGVVLEGPSLLRRGCTVGPNAYIRGATLIDRDVDVGHAVEIKNSVLMDNASVSHLSYVGDSILGRRANLGAGTCIANVRHDGEPVRVTVKGSRVSTDRRKFGAVLGDDVKTGINTSINPGVTMSVGSHSDPGESVTRDR